MSWHERGILIVGGGIAGLGLAAGLGRAGLAREVVERAPAFAPVGAGIVLGVNAMQVMRRLGLQEALLERGRVVDEMAITDARGRDLARTDLSALAPRFGPSVALHRADLHEVLLGASPGLSVRLGATVDSLVPTPDGVEVRFSDGAERVFGLVVGADGLRSRVRELGPRPGPVRYAGYTCWRMVVRRPTALGRSQEMWGRGRRFGLVPIDADRVYCFAVANAPRGVSDPEGRGVERVRQRFAGFGGPVPEVLEQLETEEQLLHNDIEEVVHHPWHREGVVLIGDAAHAMTPNMGQGAAMALEDAAVLAELLAPKPALAESLRAFEARRARRVRWVQDQSRRLGRVAQWQGRFVCALRDNLVRWAPDGAAARALVRMAEQPI